MGRLRTSLWTAGRRHSVILDEVAALHVTLLWTAGRRHSVILDTQSDSTRVWLWTAGRRHSVILPPRLSPPAAVVDSGQASLSYTVFARSLATR